MVPSSIPLVSGSWLSLLFPLVVGLVLAFLAGWSVAAYERGVLPRAAARTEKPREKPAEVRRAA